MIPPVYQSGMVQSGRWTFRICFKAEFFQEDCLSVMEYLIRDVLFLRDALGIFLEQYLATIKQLDLLPKQKIQ